MGEKFFCADANISMLQTSDPRFKDYFCLRANEDAGRIGLPEVNRGVLPGTGGTQRLSRMIVKRRAVELREVPRRNDLFGLAGSSSRRTTCFHPEYLPLI